ncbi:MAG: PKD domain-containing protein [Bacteroidales bacterium]
MKKLMKITLNFIFLILFLGLLNINANCQSNSVIVKIDSVTASNGAQVIVPVRVNNFHNMISAQGTINFNPSVATFASISQFGLPAMNMGNFGITQISSGKLVFSWSDANLAGVNLADSTIIFSIKFNIIGTSGQQTLISLTNTPTLIEFVNSSFNTVTVNSISGKITIPSVIPQINLTLLADSLEGLSGSQIIMPIRVKQFTQMLTAQGSISFNQNIVNFVSIEQIGIPGMLASDFGTSQIASGKLMFSWSDATLNGQTLPDSAIIFAIKFTIIGNAGQQTSINFVNTPTSTEFVNAALNTVAVNTKPGLINITSTPIPSNLTLKIDSLIGVNGGQIIVPLKVKDFINILSIQGTISFDQSVAEFVSVQQFGLNGMDNNSFGITMTSIGKLTFSWYDISLLGQTLPDSTVIFSIKFNLIGGQGSQTSISFSNNPLNFESINSNLNNISANLINGNIYVYSSINLNTISLISNSFCTGESISIPYTVSGVLANGNFFTAQLSDVSGNFTNSVNIGTLANTGSGIINSVIPLNTQIGNSYRIRVISSNPGITGSDNGSNITINSLPIKPDLPIGLNQICINNVNTYYSIPAINNTTSYTWQLIPSNAGSITGDTTTAIVDWTSTFTGTAKLIVKANNICGYGISSDTLIITVSPLPTKPAIPSGSISICENAANTNYTSSGSSNATSYQWSIFPSSAGNISGTTLNAVVDWSNTFTGIAKISVIGINSCGNSVTSDSLTITINPLPAKPAQPTGLTILCENNINTAYSTTVSTNATSYSWSVFPSSAGTISGTTTSMTIDWNNTFIGIAKISVNGNNACGSGVTSDTLLVTVNPMPIKPATPAGITSLCQPAATVNYTTTGSANAISYLWSIYPASAGSITGTTTSSTVTWNASFSGTAKISVKGVNICGNSISSDSLIIIINPLPAKPAIPSGSISICENATNTNYTSSGSSNATSYQWSIFPSSAGNISGTTLNAVVDWSNTFTGIAKISVIGINSCGNSVSSDSLTITINPLPTKPAQPTGIIILCENNINISYTTTGSTNALSYAWSVFPSTAGTITGTSTSMTIDWNNTYNGIAKISVLGVNTCGNGVASDSLTITLNPLPLKPATPTGTTYQCQASSAANYTTAGSTNAISYLWSIYPSTAGSIAGTTTSSTVTWNASFSGTAKISVKGVNTCGNSVASDSLTVTINPFPSKPGTPTGTVTLCENAANTNYTSSGSSNATSYQWSIFPSSAGNIAGTTLNAVVDWSNTFTGIAKIRAIGINSCGNSVTSDSLTITINPLPAKPAQPTGLIILCENNINTNYTTTGSTNALSYAWSVFPSTAGTITGTSTSMTIDWNNTYNGIAKISVLGVNTCGNGVASDSLTITLNPLPLKPATPTGTTYQCQASSAANYTTAGSTNAISYLWSIYPSTAGSIAGTTTSSTVTWNASFSGTAKISVKGVNTCGNSVASDSLTISINPLPTKPLTPSGTTTLCENAANSNFTTTGSTNAISYIWSIYPSTAGLITGTTTAAVVDWTNTYIGVAKISVIGVNACGNSVTSDSLTVTINSLPTKPGTPTGPTSLSQNSPNSNYITTGSLTAVSYQWSITPSAAASISGTSTTTIVDWTNTFTGTAKISVKSINSCGSSISSDSITVNITALPTADFQLTDDSICPGGSDTLIIHLSGTAPWSISFNNGTSNQNISNITVSPYQLIVSPIVNTIYKLLTVADANWSNTVNDSIKVFIRLLPVAYFTKTINVLNINFTNQSIAATSYSWDFGDNSPLSSQINPSHTYTDFGNYLVELTAINSCGSHTYQDSLKLINIGIQENNVSAQLTIWPNPNKGLFEIRINNIITDLQLSLYNETGRLLLNENYNFNGLNMFSKVFDLSEFPKGFYLLNFKSAEEIISRKIVIQ